MPFLSINSSSHMHTMPCAAFLASKPAGGLLSVHYMRSYVRPNVNSAMTWWLSLSPYMQEGLLSTSIAG